MTDLVREVLERKWFYRFDLPQGHQTESYLPEAVRPVHDTRLQMMQSVLEPKFEQRWEDATVLDLACHQGWFSSALAARGCRQVTGIDARAEHIDDARLMARALGQDNTRYIQCPIEDLGQCGEVEAADIVLMLGLIYHLEDPVGAIRCAHAYCREVCLIETQVGPHVSGMLDWGSSEFVRPIKGCFTVIDEVDEVHAGEASTKGICLAPSTETLLWLMSRIGFRDVALVAVPENGYEQHRHGKRVMAAGYV